MSKKNVSVIRAGGKMRPLSMKEYEKSPEDKKADAKGLKKINEKRRNGKG